MARLAFLLALIALAFPTNGQSKIEDRSGLHWSHLSSTTGDLPVPGTSTEQTGAVVADLDKSGVNGFILSFRKTAPALVWYRHAGNSWQRYVIDPAYLTVEAGGAIYDIDGDGYPDIVFGADYQGDEVWWWENPGGHYDPNTPWKRHVIKKGGKHQHHDQVFADFKGLGKPQLAFWNQGAKKLFIAEIPANPREASQWEVKEVFSGSAGEGPGKYAEGIAAIDIDGDGKPDLLAATTGSNTSATTSSSPRRSPTSVAESPPAISSRARSIPRSSSTPATASGRSSGTSARATPPTHPTGSATTLPVVT